jgi:hypothetical protein
MLPNQQSTIREYPVAMWLIAFSLLAGGGYSFYQSPGQWVVLAVTGVIALLILLLSSVLIVKADKSSGILTITHLSPIRRKIKSISIREITSIQVEQTLSGSDNGASSTYRIVVTLKGGEIVPFRSYYSSGFAAKGEKARKLRDFLGVGGEDQREGNISATLSGMAQQAYQETVNLFASSPAEERLVKGVRWQVRKVTHHGTSITRILSTDFKWSGFLYLAQKGKNQNFTRTGPFASLMKTLFQQSIGIYGFTPEDTPNREFGETPATLDFRLDAHFMAFTNDPEQAPQLLSPLAVTSLAKWAERHPLKMLTAGDKPGQLVILFSPNGLYLGSLGSLSDEQLNQMAGLGAELLRAQEYSHP